MADEETMRNAVLGHAEAGVALLAPVLTAAGFTNAEVRVTHGSGGHAAVAVWHRSDGLGLETHVRESLGIVRYLWGGKSLDHKDYLRLRGVRGAYPGFSENPEEAFRHLLTDLTGSAADLLTMSGTEFQSVVELVGQLPKHRLP